MRIPLATLAVAAVTASGLVLPALAQPAPASAAVGVQAAAVPKRTDGLKGKTVYFIHGFQISTGNPEANCKQWDKMKKAYTGLGAKVVTVAYYKKDKNCSTRVSSWENGASIKTMAKSLAKNIYDKYTSKGKSVDVVGHSMGGLIVRAAITGVQRKEAGFPSKLYIEDVVTMGTPHLGVNKAKASLCRLLVCREMSEGSSFLKWLGKTKNPQSAQGTDWTLIGSNKDGVVAEKSATSQTGSKAGWMSAGHKIVYQDSAGVGHSEYYSLNKGTYSLKYWNFTNPKWVPQSAGVGLNPVLAARRGNHFWRSW
ncbi:esterase/lipase family protein [Actinoplanes derwentensis]|uniref:Putative serine esterase n=1 Tax=Actinoplanes derwentensis TaxID=113562 RepID=A0A1H1U839_9ACTN|nr:hypothetical protein [Actinoplanes derwentensis]GID85210.1 hypothetical protein Ade03nite_41340 [Actinoplanes derwentensis]SDS67989.1 Putative serine esterase [Actinoplanes derwentensis]